MRWRSIHHVNVLNVAHDAARVHALARHGANRDFVTVVHLGLVFIVAVCIALIHAELGIALAIDVVLLRRQYAAIFYLGVFSRTHERAQIQAFAAQAGNRHNRVVHHTTALYGAVVHIRTIKQLARDDATHDARVGNQRDRVVGRRDRDSAILHAHRFDACALGPTYQHAAAEVGANVAILKMNVVDIGALGEGEQTHVGGGLPKITVVVQANDVVTLAVEGTLEWVVFVAEGEGAIRVNDFLKLVTFSIEFDEVDISVKNDVRLVRHHARRRNLPQELIDSRDMHRSVIGVIGQRLLRRDERRDRKQNCCRQHQRCKYNAKTSENTR